MSKKPIDLAQVEMTICALLAVGDLAAAAELTVTQICPTLMPRIMSRMRSRADADAVYSDFVWNVLVGMPSYHGKGSVRNWCSTIATNATRRFWREKRRRGELFEAFSSLSIAHNTPLSCAPTTSLEAYNWLDEICGTLTGERGRIFEGRRQGLSHRALALQILPAAWNDRARLKREEARIRKIYKRLLDCFRNQAPTLN